MVHFFEEIWRFKELGLLWAACFALIIAGLKVVPQYIKNRSLLNCFLVFMVAASVYVSYLLLNSKKKDSKKDKTPSYINTVDTAITTIVRDTSISTPIPDIPDSIRLSQSFVVGTWDATWDNVDVKETITFDYGSSDEIRIKGNCMESNIVFCDHSTDLPFDKIVSRKAYKEAILRLRRIGPKRKGVLKISDYDLHFREAKETRVYYLTFTRRNGDKKRKK